MNAAFIRPMRTKSWPRGPLRIGPAATHEPELLLAVLSLLDLYWVRNFVVRRKVGGLGQAVFAALTFHINVLESSRGYLPANWDVLAATVDPIQSLRSD